MTKIALEVAEEEFERMCRSRRLSTDPDDMDGDDYEGLMAIKKRLVRTIMRGELVINDDGDPIYTPPVDGAKPLHFHRPTGATFMAMDSRGSDGEGNQARMVRVITDMTRSAKGEIAKLEAPDYTICTLLSNLFLAGRS